MNDINQAIAPIKRKYTKRQVPQREAEIRTKEVTREPIRERKVRVRKGGFNRLEPPQNIKDDFEARGMDLLWVTDSVNGQPTPQIRAEYEINGWEPILGKDHPEVAAIYMPKGWQGEINVGGLILEQRPMELTQEARAEERQAASNAMGSLQSNLRAGNIPGVTMDTQTPNARANTRLTREVLRGIPVTKD